MNFQNSSEKWTLFRSLRLPSLVNQAAQRTAQRSSVCSSLFPSICTSLCKWPSRRRVVPSHYKASTDPRRLKLEFWLITLIPHGALQENLHLKTLPPFGPSALTLPVSSADSTESAPLVTAIACPWLSASHKSFDLTSGPWKPETGNWFTNIM